MTAHAHAHLSEPYHFVGDRLAQGSAPLPGDASLESFDRIVLCAMEYQPTAKDLGAACAIVHCPLDDAKPSADEIRRAIAIAEDVARAHRRGDRVLVTCAAGRNRSGLVVGLAILELGRGRVPAKGVVDAIRMARGPLALSNQHFVRVLELHAERLAQLRAARARA